MMKANFYILMILILQAACAPQKFTAQSGDYHSSKSPHVAGAGALTSGPETPIPAPDIHTLVAGTTYTPIAVQKNLIPQVKPGEEKPALSQSEKRELRREAVKSVKAYIRAKKQGDENKAAELARGMDNDLKWAAIFGAIGFVGLFIGGDLFHVLGAIALIIGVVFFVIWLSRQ